MIQWTLAVWSLVPLPFLNPVCISEHSLFTYCWNLAWRILSMWNECNSLVLNILWLYPSLGWNENWPFPVLGPLPSFQICWHIECSTLAAASFRIWNSSARIPSSPLDLLKVLLSKAHLASRSVTDHIIMLIRVIKVFLYSLSVYSCHPFLISSASVRSIPFLSFIVPIFAWIIPLVSNFLDL